MRFLRYVGEMRKGPHYRNIKFKEMTRILKVVKPFFVMEPDDTFELSQDGTSYVSSINVEHHETDDANSDITSRYSSNYTISIDFAKTLVDTGYLTEVQDKENKFVNVFDEINSLLDTYQDELNRIDSDMEDMPACLKVEKETVLNNLITVLDHLSSLRK